MYMLEQNKFRKILTDLYQHICKYEDQVWASAVFTVGLLDAMRRRYAAPAQVAIPPSSFLSTLGWEAKKSNAL